MPTPRACPRTGPTLAGVLAVAGVLALAGCGTSAVQVSTADHALDPLCGKVADAWPATVAGKGSVATSATSPTVHAWGDPAIIARCGVTSPGATTDPCFDVSGVDWVGHQLSDGYRFVTFGRTPAIEVLVPHHYSPEPLVLGAFTNAASAVPQGAHHCTASG